MVATVFFRGTGVAFVDTSDLWIPVAPDVASLTGINASQALDAAVPVDDPATRPVLEEMIGILAENGFVDIALSGSFGLRIGALQVTFSYWQAGNVPCCDLEYAQTHNASTSACNNPPTQIIKGRARPVPIRR